MKVEASKRLRQPFPPEAIGTVDKGFGPVDFVGHAVVTDRLLEVDPDWTFEIYPVEVVGRIETFEDERGRKLTRFVPDPEGLPHVLAVRGTMTILGVTRPEVGEVDRFTSYGDELKKGISDFVRRGAMRFGVALDLWSKEDLGSSGPTQGESRVESPETAGTPGREVGPGSSVPGALPEEEAEDGGGSEDAPRGVSTPPARRYPIDAAECSHRYPSGRLLPFDEDGRCPKCGTPKVSAVEGTTADLGGYP